MTDPDVPAAPFPALAPREIGGAVSGLAPAQRLTLLGVDRRGLSELLRAEADLGRAVLFLAPADARGAGGLIDGLLDDLAEIALSRWPGWRQRGGASGPWLRAAGERAAAGRPPRLRKAGAGAEFAGLRAAVDPRGVAVAAEVDPASARRARGTVEALEWCADHGAPTVALLPHRPAPVAPYDRLLYGARALLPPPEPAADRFIAPPDAPGAPGAPHPGSDTERRVRAALDGDAELGPLFACNRRVADAGLVHPRVDLLWAEGRVVVELDGPEHQAGARFGADRHRDYELLVAGYHVLRITNAQVATDLAQAVEKIRAVVRFSRERRTAT